ncbi:hypothetical protein [uncultured Psychromonas sp.]|uniref:hypothetical protein n=1 Tax=uncultured Psychromonas sp. TaxID=173974 RepID=UPI002630DA79|nr:hypothetical protein [uncultured Psychromonas sp.]
MKSQQISKSDNYILEHCVDKLARINNSDYAIGFLVDDNSSPYLINVDSQTVSAPELLFEPIKHKLNKDLIDYFSDKPCLLNDFFVMKGMKVSMMTY